MTDDAFIKVTELIKNNIDTLNRLAEKLVEKEILEGDELLKLLNGEIINNEQKQIEKSVKEILIAIGENPDREGLKKTPSA